MLTSFDSSTIIGGPAAIQYEGSWYYSEGDIVVTIDRRHLPVEASGLGVVAHRFLQKVATITGTLRPVSSDPATLRTDVNALLAVPAGPGRLRFGPTDKTLRIYSLTEGQSYIYKRVAITGLPTVTLGVDTANLLGPSTFTGLKANDEPDEDLEEFEEIAAGVQTPTALSNYNNGPWEVVLEDFEDPDTQREHDGIHTTANGITLTPQIQLADVLTDAAGLVDQRVTDASVQAQWTPMGLPHDLIHAITYASANDDVAPPRRGGEQRQSPDRRKVIFRNGSTAIAHKFTITSLVITTAQRTHSQSAEFAQFTGRSAGYAALAMEAAGS